MNWAVFTWEKPYHEAGKVTYQDRNATFNNSVRDAIRKRGAAENEVPKHEEKLMRGELEWFRLIKDGHLPQEKGKETWDFQQICTGFVAPRGQRLGERQRKMMGKTQWRHCERSFGTNVLVLGKERDNLLSPSNLLKRTSRKISI